MKAFWKFGLMLTVVLFALVSSSWASADESALPRSTPHVQAFLLEQANSPSAPRGDRSPLDYATVWVDDDYTPSTPGWGSYAFATIQNGINAVDPGGTVNVAPGTYYEHNINVNKSLTLTGDPGDASPGCGVNAPIVDGQNVWQYGFTLANGVSNVAIQGFEIRNYVGPLTGDGDAILAWVPSTSYITVTDNFMHHLSWNGVLVGDDGATGDHSYWTVARNVLTDYGPTAFAYSGYGLELTNTSHGLIEDNLIDAGTRFPAIAILVTGRRALEEDIVIRRNRVRGAFDNAGIYVAAAGYEVTNATLQDVHVENNDVDISGPNPNSSALRVNQWDTGVITDVTAFGNKLMKAGGYGLRSASADVVNASGNWWGDNTPAGVAAKLGGSVDYTPWLNVATDMSGTNGFQGDFSQLVVDDSSPQSGAQSRISEGIGMVSGSTVYMAPGTYSQGITTIASSLTLRAFDTAIPPTITPTASTPGVGSQDPTAGWFVVNSGVTANFEYLNFNASGQNIGHVIHHQGPGHITHCEFTNVYWGLNYGIGIVSRGAYAFEVDHCTFSNIERIGAHFNHYTASPKLYHDNTFTGKGAGLSINYACEAERTANVLAENNVISNCTGVAGDGSTSAAFLATTYFGGSPATRLEAHHNVLTNNTDAFAIGYDGSDVTVVVATENKFEGNTYGVNSLSTVRVEAILNWWGDVNGPSPILLLSNPGQAQPMDVEENRNSSPLDDGSQGSVHYSPWIASSGADNSGADGWQPNKSVLGVSTNGTIQEGIDNVSGSTVNVAAGTYEEQLHITTNNLNLVGAGVGSTIIQAPNSMPLYFTTSANNRPVIFVDGATGVSVSNLTVDGLGRGNTNYRFQGIAYWNAGGSISNVYVTNVKDTPFSGAQHGVGIYAFNNTPLSSYTLNVTDVTVDNYQKNAFALNGNGNLTANLLRVTTTGAGATGVTAQNGIQIWGGTGTVNDCDVTGNAYTGGGWAAAGYLFIEANVTVSGGCTSTNNQVGYDFDDASGSVSGGSATNNGSTPAYSAGVVVVNWSAAAGGTRPRTQPLEDPVSVPKGGSQLDDVGDESVAISGMTMTGALSTNSYGVDTYNDAASDVIVSITGSTIAGWESGVSVYRNAGTISSATVSGNYLSNTYNAYDNVAGHTYSNNCWSDFGSNSGFPTQYNVAGGGGNADNNPSSDCSNIDMVMSSDYIGCVAACAKDTLYLRWDGVDYFSATVTLTLPSGFAADWTGINPEIRPAVPQRTANLQMGQASESGSTIVVDVVWGPGALRTVNDNLYFAAIPLTNVSAGHGTLLNPTITSYIFVDASGPHTGGYSITPAGSVVDCQAPAATLTGGGGEASCNAYNSAGEFNNQLSYTMAAFNTSHPTSPLASAYMKLGSQTWTLALANGTFPTGSESPSVWTTMTEGCNTFELHVFDTECNEATVSVSNVIKDVSAPTISGSFYTQSACYNNISGDAQYGATKLDADMNISVPAPLACTAGSLSLSFTFTNASGSPTYLALDHVGSVSGYPDATQASSLWSQIVTAYGTSFSGTALVDVKIEDCAGNVTTYPISICIDFVAPSNAFTVFDARPAFEGIWLTWAWTYNATQATAVEIYRKAEWVAGDPATDAYPVYNSDKWASDPNYEKVHSNVVNPANGWTLAVSQAGPSNSAGAYPGTHGGPSNTYWKDPTGTDDVSSRSIYRYVTFVRDAAGNWSQVSSYLPVGTTADRSTNYWLGDYSLHAGNPGPLGAVDGTDLGLLAAHYFQAVAPSFSYLNIGPENNENGYGKGIPNPDGFINFADLMPFSFNFGVLGAGSFNVRVPSSGDFEHLDTQPIIAVTRSTDAPIIAGEEFTVNVALSGNSSNATKIAEAQIEYDPMVLEFVEAAAAEAPVSDGVPFSVARAVEGTSNTIGVVSAAVGEIGVLNGDFTMATLTFRWKSDNVPSTSLNVTSAQMADAFGHVISSEGSVFGFGATGIIPTSYALYQNYPNPFNPTTLIRYDLPEDANVRLVIYNVMGQEVRTLVSGTMPAGAHHITWDGLSNGGQAVGTGLYVYRISANHFSATHKMLLTR